MSVFDDADWLLEHLQALTSQQEVNRDYPWAVTDAPADYLVKQLKGIVGFEFPITRIEGKWKFSQNKAEKDREGVVQGLNIEGSPSSIQVADLIPPRK